MQPTKRYFNFGNRCCLFITPTREEKEPVILSASLINYYTPPVQKYPQGESELRTIVEALREHVYILI
jgi:hypothetical protein